ncbi:MAG: hypothetical protein KAS32_11830 [Candidatus Peribacteraceae bacterium]|nr:hypothetical protein [Candidatus Peribacteraceae bacterium]
MRKVYTQEDARYFFSHNSNDSCLCVMGEEQREVDCFPDALEFFEKRNSEAVMKIIADVEISQVIEHNDEEYIRSRFNGDRYYRSEITWYKRAKVDYINVSQPVSLDDAVLLETEFQKIK